MAHGPGKYDTECEAARRATGAIATLLIILGGRHGSGFSMTTMENIGQAPGAVQVSVMERMPALLRDIANQIENDLTPERQA